MDEKEEVLVDCTGMERKISDFVEEDPGKDITINTDHLRTVAENIEMAQVEDKLILVIDLKKTIGLSSTGKMMGIASTAGFTPVPGSRKIKMNLYLGEKV